MCSVINCPVCFVLGCSLAGILFGYCVGASQEFKQYLCLIEESEEEEECEELDRLYEALDSVDSESDENSGAKPKRQPKTQDCFFWGVIA